MKQDDDIYYRNRWRQVTPISIHSTAIAVDFTCRCKMNFINNLFLFVVRFVVDGARSDA